ncbi:hypothetical protein B0H66DRAFT_5919 [Apodospora peruviana]|uniref:Uncharacterized protein n=1 Tax=Apodospora peruviana TaxID=516989 RepID=A0AAE0IPR4_9PEZI|nr:hypothetical protein B0H66DRAFT_5919 [Apodospora peruviana]
MGGLIPLMLTSSGGRSSFISPHALPARHSSLDATQTGRPANSGRRLSYTPPANLPVLPHTHAEWKREVADIKRLHFGKRWRVCSAKCNEILDNIKDTTNAEPVFLIYLHFYAATSMEICARPLPPTSPFRTSLLQQARSHFERASSLITAAEESALRKLRPGSVNSSRGYNCHSPSESLSSQSSSLASSRSWTPVSQVSSPTTSVYSFEDLSAKSQFASPVKRVKKVSFSLPHEQHIEPEPVKVQPIPRAGPLVRPDSPTLGFDDECFQTAAAVRQDLPDLPKPKFEEVELPLRNMSEPEQIALGEDAFFIARSVDRYCDHLSALRVQLTRHTAYLDDMLSEKVIHTPRALAETSSSRTSLGADLRALDKQARIERLRANGWQRKRFDARRYEELYDTVMAELA